MALLSGAIVYVKISTNKLSLRVVGGAEALNLVADPPFSDKRMLVGNFSSAEALLKRGVKSVRHSWLSPSPRILIHPLEQTDGGLNQVEARLYRELALSAGARGVVVWSGAELTDAEVTAKFEDS